MYLLGIVKFKIMFFHYCGGMFHDICVDLIGSGRVIL